MFPSIYRFSDDDLVSALKCLGSSFSDRVILVTCATTYANRTDDFTVSP